MLTDAGGIEMTAAGGIEYDAGGIGILIVHL